VHAREERPEGRVVHRGDDRDAGPDDPGIYRPVGTVRR
jgi:hypothetical protein